MCYTIVGYLCISAECISQILMVNNFVFYIVFERLVGFAHVWTEGMGLIDG